jgi:hypothetical protein
MSTQIHRTALDPQDVGLGVYAGQGIYPARAARAASRSAIAAVRPVWSPGGPTRLRDAGRIPCEGCRALRRPRSAGVVVMGRSAHRAIAGSPLPPRWAVPVVMCAVSARQIADSERR